MTFVQTWELGETGPQIRACPFCYTVRSAEATAMHVEEDHPQEHMLMVTRASDPRSSVAASDRRKQQGELW
jgi:hypothetical protein